MPTVADIERDIDRLFSDTSVAQSQTREDLEAIREHIDGLLETLPEGD